MNYLSHPNIASLLLVQHRLKEVSDDFVFVGGCIANLLITDRAAPKARITKDVDCIVNVITLSDYYMLATKLRNKGFKEYQGDNQPLCRWDCDGVLVDIMPIEKNILGFSNRWYKEALSTAISIDLDIEKVKIISAPYFLATKLEAFKDRGQRDFLGSHDLEDIIAVLDGREEVVSEIKNASVELKLYFATVFSILLSETDFLQALPGHLEMESRKNIVLERIQDIIGDNKIAVSGWTSWP